MTEREQEKNSRLLRLQQERSDGRWLTDDTTEQGAEMQTTIADGNVLADLIPERVHSIWFGELYRRFI